jgi:hypothetical protein
MTPTDLITRLADALDDIHQHSVKPFMIGPWTNYIHEVSGEALTEARAHLATGSGKAVEGDKPT